ncbi:MAG: NADH-quinone oxidoreductase subunit C [Terracidiphilus sp.]|jgi:NADH:ubiquinone oxidoreductase subunit C
MTALENLREKLGIAEPWVESRGTHWLNPCAASVRQVAQAMNAAGARFVTITAYELPGDAGFRLEYHWDLGGRLLGVPFQIAGKSIESIFDLSEAADWIEREIHEGFAIDFTGREYEPLMLRPGDKPGVNLRVAPAPDEPASGLQGQKEVAK